MKTVLIVGSGDVARRAIPWLATRFRVLAMIRDPEQAAALRALGARPILADLDNRRSLARLAGVADFVLHMAPPDEGDARDHRSRRLCAALSARGSLPQGFTYISTTGVYGDCAGAWVDETRAVAPNTVRARRRVDAERVLRRFALRNQVALAILRAPGIYADERLPLERLRRGDPVLSPEDDVHTNHIHADDLARAACLALFRARGGRVFNVVDDSDLRMGDYFDRVADVFGLPRPPRLSREEATRVLRPVTLSFMSESRRIGNRRLKSELRMHLALPTVEDGLARARIRFPD